MAVIPGWYGKIPCLGDFASRRLPPEFIDSWDAWLQQSITASRRMLGDGWLDVYLTSPMWRFALMPGVCGECAWAGLLMPSVDKVGRHFPLTLAVALGPELHCGPAALEAAQCWYAEMERIALSALSVDSVADDLERNLAQCPFPAADMGRLSRSAPIERLVSWWQDPSDEPQSLQLAARSSLTDTLATLAEQFLSQHAAGKALWWSENRTSGSLDVHCSNRLPAPDYFVELLAGSPRQRDRADEGGSHQAL